MIPESTNSLIRSVGSKRYQGSSLSKGTLYHDLPFDGYAKVRSHRKGTADRWSYIKANSGLRFVNESIIDLGCSVGGISMLAAQAGAWVNGFDYDFESLEVAQSVSKELGLHHNVKFHHQTIDLDFIKNKMSRPHILIWMSHWMWCVKQFGMQTAKEMLYEASLKSNVMIFESAADDAMAAIKGATQDDIGEWVRSETSYSRVEDIGFVPGWNNRHIFVCKGIEVGWRGYTSRVTRESRTTVRKTFKPGFEWMVEREVKFLKMVSPHGISPQVISSDKTSIEMTYCGKKRKLSKVHRNQCMEILNVLKVCNISHRDINPKNLLVYNGDVVLIDYAWSLFEGETETPKPPPKDTLGGAFYKDNRGNDAVGLERTLKHFGI